MTPHLKYEILVIWSVENDEDSFKSVKFPYFAAT